jgi:NADPH:quinone reductase-like Zn-dependent oxidoreductase
MGLVKTTKAWTVNGTDGFESLKLNEQFPLDELTDHDILIRLHAVSLNYRDVAIPKVRLRRSL